MTINHSEFPNLRTEGFEPKSELDESYNCIAWAAGVSDAIWDPDEDQFWPDGAGRDYTIAALVDAFRRIGFSECGKEETGIYEPGIQKIAIYGTKDIYEHAARQLRNGQWTSKLGPEDDIRHATVTALTAGSYGHVQAFLKRPYPSDKVLGDDD